MASPVEIPPSLDDAEKAKTLIGALNLISRNLPLPPDVFTAVSSIYFDDEGEEREEEGGEILAKDSEAKGGDSATETKDSIYGVSTKGTLISEFDDALLKQEQGQMSSLALRQSKENRFQSLIRSRLTELEELPSSRGEDMQMKCLLELYGLKLVELQRKVRSNVSAEYWLHEKCAYPDRQLFDWGMMRLRHPFSMYGIGDAFAMETDDRQRKKRDAERLSRWEEEEKNRNEMRKRKFFADLLNTAREFQLQAQAASKRRKVRNDHVQQWHGRQRQRATRAEKLRYQALKADDQEAYMKMVEESKNERLTMLLGKTNELLVCLGAAVQRQKDAEHTDKLETLKGSETVDPSVSPSTSGTPEELPVEEEVDAVNADSGQKVKANDLLEGQRQYNSAVHSIQETVKEQPSMLQGGELRPYQLEGLQWMLSLFNNNLNGILADEMGLGKTIQTIALIAYLMENKGVTGPHLIIAPKAVLSNWVNEFATWAPSIVAVLYDGRQDERKSIWKEYSGEGKFNVMITHYDLIMRDKIALKKIHWYYMIVDEGHRLKNHECSLAQTIGGYRIRRRLLLTGTPIQNSLQELWALLNFLLPTIFNSVQNFEEWFNAPFADRCEISLNDEEELLIIRRLHHVIRPFLLRRKKDEVEKYLPTKTQVILKCDLSAWQKAYYRQVTEIGRVGLESGSGKSKGLMNLTMQLRKCCNHPYLFVGRDYNMWQKEQIVRASGKFELLDRLLPKLQISGHRVLLFSTMTKLIDILEVYLQLHDLKYLRLDGSTKTEERGTLLKQFNAPDSPYFIFLLSTRAGGLGLNLQTADTVIIFDSDWNPQMDLQAEDRAHRIGQKKDVRVFILASVGTVEEDILERAKQKKGIDAKVIQAGLFNAHATGEDRKALLQEIMRRGTSSLGTDVPSEREINRLAARTDEEFWLFEKMDEERRQRERYQSRLMEENEVPEWVFPKDTEEEIKASLEAESQSNGLVTGKRRRKDVVYADQLSDYQWMKAVEDGEDVSTFSSRKKRKKAAHAQASHESVSDDGLETQVTPEPRTASRYSLVSEGSDDMSSRTPRISFVPTGQQSNGDEDDEFEGDDSSWRGSVVTWRTHKRKRSSHGIGSSSSDAKGL